MVIFYGNLPPEIAQQATDFVRLAESMGKAITQNAVSFLSTTVCITARTTQGWQITYSRDGERETDEIVVKDEYDELWVRASSGRGGNL